MIPDRHRREFARAIRDKAWERTAEGIYFPRQKALLHGHVSVNDGPRQANFISAWGVYGLWNSMLVPGGVAANLSLLYVAPWANDVDAQSLDTAIDTEGFAQSDDWFLYRHLGELASGAEGYSQAKRQLWNYADVGGALLSNSGNPAAFTIATASTITVRGFALIGVENARSGFPGDYPTAAGSANYYKARVVYATDPVLVNERADTMRGYYREIANTEVDVADNPHGSCVITNYWYDPSNDDYYDGNNWVDPSGDDIADAAATSTPIFAMSKLISPLVLNNNDPLNVTWGIQLS